MRFDIPLLLQIYAFENVNLYFEQVILEVKVDALSSSYAFNHPCI